MGRNEEGLGHSHSMHLLFAKRKATTGCEKSIKTKYQKYGKEIFPFRLSVRSNISTTESGFC